MTDGRTVGDYWGAEAWQSVKTPLPATSGRSFEVALFCRQRARGAEQMRTVSHVRRC
jgi:hypothetical protein